MATNTWDTSWEKQPQDLSNPGKGAEQIRIDKVNVRERLEVEHSFGEDEQTVASQGGVHLEGSGRVFVEQDDATGDDDADRITTGSRLDPGDIVTEDLSGRTVVDLNELTTVPEINEAEISTGNILNKVRTIQCYDVDGNLLTVFDPTTFISSVIDQVSTEAITGIKEFTNRLWLQSTGYTDRTTFDGYTPGSTEETDALKELLPRDEIDTRDDLAANSGVYDPTGKTVGGDGITDDNFEAYTWPDMPTGWVDFTGAKRSTRDITCNQFAATEVWAERLYGAVYTA